MRKKSVGSLAAGGAALLVLAMMAAAGFVSGAKAQADDPDLQPLRNVGDGYKSVHVISKYDIHPETHSFDLTAMEPNDNSIGRQTRVDIATQVAQEICENHVIPRGWTIHMFLPGETEPAATCNAGGAPPAHKPARKTHHKHAQKPAPKPAGQ
jgi:hypothetical protein